MTAVLEPPPASPGAEDLLTARVRGRRRAADLLASTGIVLSFALALAPLLLILWFLVHKGIGIVDAGFLTKDIPFQPRATGPGMGPAVAGTLLITAAASALAIPLGVLAAIYLTEFGSGGALARLIRFLSGVMTGVPSVVVGLFIYVAWVTRVHAYSGFAGALALACLMLPIVIRSTDEMLQLVPHELREGSAALGARSFRTTFSVVIPSALGGIVSGATLAVARAAGETAPLLLTIAVVNRTTWSLSGPNTTLSAQIFRNATSPFQGAQDRAWGAALTLVALVFALTVLARALAGRCTARQP
jgi:phosphate transport system permease protein